MPDSRTFNIPPIKKLLNRYCTPPLVIIDPFANQSTIGTIRNDLNPEYDTDYHLDALQFLKQIDSDSADVVLYDPPYSITQASECYHSYGRDKLETNVANMKYWSMCKDNVARILHAGGYAICFGWNTNGLGINRFFDMKEILIVPHGGSRNDTMVTVEQKITSSLF